MLRLLFNGIKMVSQSPVPTCKINIRMHKMKQSRAIIIFPALLNLYHTYVLEDVTRDLQCNSDADWPELFQILQIKGTVPCKTALTSDTNCKLGDSQATCISDQLEIKSGVPTTSSG